MKNIPVIAEEQILDSLKSHEDDKDLKIGLIIGQHTYKKRYVVHFAPTPNVSLKAVADLKNDDLADVGEHAKYVTRMLPGGLWVLGAYVISDCLLFNNSNNDKLKKIVDKLDVSENQGFCYYGKYPSDSYLLFHYNVTSKQYTCQSIDKNSEFKAVDWKFENTTSPWYQINSEFSLDGTYFDASKDISFQEKIKNFLDQAREEVSSLSVCLFEKEWEPTNYLEQIMEIKKSDETVLDVTLYLTPKTEGSSEVRTEDSLAQLEVGKSIRSRISLHPRTTVEEATNAIREDIFRSLSTRIELHWDSLVGEEKLALEKGERVHEPPRRVLIQPQNWNVFVWDYLYPGEEIDQAIKSCQDLLGITIEEKDIIDDFEIPAGRKMTFKRFLSETNEYHKKLFRGYHIHFFVIMTAFYIVIAAKLISNAPSKDEIPQ